MPCRNEALHITPFCDSVAAQALPEGTVLDGELLAEVYIGMTRGQDALLIDLGAGEVAGGKSHSKLDLSQYQLPVIEPSSAELQQHEDVLSQMDKSSGGKVVFRQATGVA